MIAFETVKRNGFALLYVSYDLRRIQMVGLEAA